MTYTLEVYKKDNSELLAHIELENNCTKYDDDIFELTEEVSLILEEFLPSIGSENLGWGILNDSLTLDRPVTSKVREGIGYFFLL